jgi:hypothetical protein
LLQPVIENCQNITFLCHTYVYDELLEQMLKAKLSVFNNKWTEVFDFTPHRGDGSGLNYSLKSTLYPEFVSPFDKVSELVTKVSQARGAQIMSLKQVTEVDDLDQIELEF